MSMILAMGLVIVGLNIFSHQGQLTLSDNIKFIDGNNRCVVNTDKCYTHEDLQRPDGLLDLEKYEKASGKSIFEQ